MKFDKQMKFEYYGCRGSEFLYENAACIANMEAESFEHAWSIESIMSAVKSGYVTYITAFGNNGEAVGFSCVQAVLGEAELLRIAVRPAYRGRGIGREILSNTLSFLKESDSKYVFLEVNENNEAALCLYKSFGFERIAVRKKYYENGADAVIMKLDAE